MLGLILIATICGSVQFGAPLDTMKAQAQCRQSMATCFQNAYNEQKTKSQDQAAFECINVYNKTTIKAIEELERVKKN